MMDTKKMKERYDAIRKEKLGKDLPRFHRKMLVDKECEYCGKEFKRRTAWQKYCGVQCRENNALQNKLNNDKIDT